MTQQDKELVEKLLAGCSPISKEELADINSAAVDAASNNDWRWFKKHPNRRYRIRKPFPREWQGRPWMEGEPDYEIVYQIKPGFRIRKPYHGALSKKAMDFMNNNGTVEVMKSGGLIWIPPVPDFT